MRSRDWLYDKSSEMNCKQHRQTYQIKTLCMSKLILESGHQYLDYGAFLGILLFLKNCLSCVFCKMSNYLESEMKHPV